MKKIVFVCFMFLIVFSLVACGESTKTNSSESNAEKKEQSKKNNTSSFKDGIFKTKDYTLKIINSKIIKSKMEDSEGLFITYEITNESNKKIVPEDTLLNLKVVQNSDTSEIELEDNYYFYDAFGPEEDTKTYNEMLDKGKLGENNLLPHKTTKFYKAYSLDNDKKQVVVTAIDPITYKEIDSHKINLH